MSLNLDRLLAVAEDTAFTDGDELVPVGGYIQDTLASSADDGDYTPSKYNLKGELYTIDTDGNALLTTIDADTSSMAVDLGTIDTIGTINTNIAALTQVEDALHGSGDSGIMSLAVRNDAGTALAADGDYIPLSTDASGNLRVAGSLTIGPPDTAIAAAAFTVGTSEVALPTTPLAGRDEITIQNRGPHSVYVGPTGVTTATGLEISKRSSQTVKLGPNVDIFGISPVASSDVRTFEAA